jgi:hypothetical protein
MNDALVDVVVDIVDDIKRGVGIVLPACFLLFLQTNTFLLVSTSSIIYNVSSPENSMFELSRWAQRVGKEVRDGTLKLQYTYEEFKRQVQKIPKTTDFSRLAIYAMEEREKAARQVERRTSSSSNILTLDISDDDDDDNSDDSDIELIGPSRLDYREKKETKSSNNNHHRATSGNPKRAPHDVKVVSKREKKDTKQALVDYSSWSTAQLKKECTKYGLPQTGKKAELIDRLHGPRPPQVWLERKQRGEYIPRSHDCGATALCVALLLMEQEQEAAGNYSSDHPGFARDDVYMKAEELCITKNPFSGGTTQTGPYHYDGWANMGKLLVGDPPLIVKKRNRFKLTKSCAISGYPLAKALHKWCHEHNHCSCGGGDDL